MPTTAVPSEFATRRQTDFISDLLDKKDLFKSPRFFDTVNAMDEGELAQYIDRLKEQVKSISKKRASQIIEGLVALPDKHPSLQRGERKLPQGGIKSDVPAGRYAITGEDGSTDFYRVDRPTEGRWAGRIFVKLQISDSFERIPLRNVQTVLNKIAAAGPEQASKRYGKELGRCGVCGRTLTNNESIERGIGPVCAEKHGWSF